MKDDYLNKILNNKFARSKYFEQLDRMIRLLRDNNYNEAALDYAKTKKRVIEELNILEQA